jgi:hypothetical protein
VRHVLRVLDQCRVCLIACTGRKSELGMEEVDVCGFKVVIYPSTRALYEGISKSMSCRER